MRYLYAVMLLALALLGACDRFEHDFVTEAMQNFDDVLFTPLDTAFEASTAADVNLVMDYYADDYLQYGISKNSWGLTLRALLNGVANPEFEVTLTHIQQQSSNNAIVDWRLLITNPATKSVIADSSFVGEHLVKRSGKWLLRGNQINYIPGASKQLVIAEYFTFASCDNCPPAEAKLKELQQQYPHNFIYLEQHTSGALQIAGDTTPSYYGAYSPPVSIFNGMAKVTQSLAPSLALYQSQVNQLVTVDSPINYHLIDRPIAVDGVLSCSVQLTPTTPLDQSNVVLNYVLIEEESPYSNTHVTDGSKLHNVVLARGRMDISNTDLTEPIDFTLNVPQNLPNDSRLVVFAQKRPTPFQNNATILGGITEPLYYWDILK